MEGQRPRDKEIAKNIKFIFTSKFFAITIQTTDPDRQSAKMMDPDRSGFNESGSETLVAIPDII